MKHKKTENASESNGDGALPRLELPITVKPLRHGSGGGGGGSEPTFFEPQREPTPGSGSSHGGGRAAAAVECQPPEKRLTLFALQLAVLEKAASGLGALAFVWATVVLLGGFASTLRLIDFWSITVILVGEGARIFSRSHELEWQRHATRTSTGGGALRSSSRFLRRVVRALFRPPSAAAPEPRGARAISAEDARRAQLFQNRVVAYLKLRSWHAPEVSLLPYTGWVFVSKNISRLLNWLQVLSALTCVGLSLYRLWRHDYGEVNNDTRNRRPALLLFYILALAEAVLFLLEKAYWTWKIVFCRLLDQVSSDCSLGVYGLVSLRRFFYDAYSQCVTGSIFDGIKMDLVTFAQELIESDFLDEQLIGVRILWQFGASERFAPETLRKVGTSAKSIERLIEMLNWKNREEVEVRRCAAEIVSRLAGRQQNALRVAGIPGAIESVMSLLYTGHSALANEREAAAVAPSYDYMEFNLLGLQILLMLAGDHDNCGKIGNTRGLLAKIVQFTHASPALLRNPLAAESQIEAVRLALQVVRMLVRTTGKTGKMLRQDTAEIVFTVSNLRGILLHGEQHRDLQKLAMEIVTGLAMDDRVKEGVATTGGIVRLLLAIFFEAGEGGLSFEAGEALAMLALESSPNCAVILRRGDVLDRLVTALDDGVLRLNATRILRNLCAYSGPESSGCLHGVTLALPAVLTATMRSTTSESEKLLEVSIGLTTQICKFIDDEQFAAELQRAGTSKEEYVERLVSILKQYKYPELKVPRMRRFVVQQAIWLMRAHGEYVGLFGQLGMERLLESVADTTSDLECFHVFSGSVGLSKHRKTVSAIVESALELLAGKGAREE